MDRITLRKLTRRIALALIISLQLAHCYLQITYIWSPFPQKPNRKLSTCAKLNELGFITFSAFKIALHDVDVKVGRFLIQGFGIEALLWATVAWSTWLVGTDVWYTAHSTVATLQLLAVDVLAWTAMLSSALELVERQREDEVPVDEKSDGKVAVVEEV